MRSVVRRPLGVTLLIGFFFFGSAMCVLTIFLLLFPETSLDVVWKLKVGARDELMRLRLVAAPVMLMTGLGCALAAVGLARAREWGRLLGIALIAVNVLGDCINAVVGHDWRTLIGLPVGGTMIVYLCSRRVRQWIKQSSVAGRVPS